MLATRTIAAKLPYTRLETKRNSSAVPQMSAPDPSMVHVPPENAVVPAAPTAPMSLLENPPGTSVIAKRPVTAIQSRPPPVEIMRSLATSLAGPGFCQTH